MCVCPAPSFKEEPPGGWPGGIMKNIIQFSQKNEKVNSYFMKIAYRIIMNKL